MDNSWYNRCNQYSCLSNKQGGWNKRGKGAKVPELISVQDRINEKGEFIFKFDTRGG